MPKVYRPDEPDEPGLYISSIKVAGYETRGYFEVAHFTIDPPPSEGRNAGCHKHKTGFETWIILDGELEMGTAAGDDPVTCPAGTVIQANVNAVHCPNTVKRVEIIMIYPALFFHYWQHELLAFKRYHPGLKDDPVFREWSFERIDSFSVHEA